MSNHEPPPPLSASWVDSIAQRLLGRGLMQSGICLILGGADTGKTTLAAVLAEQAASTNPVGIVDADVGQSHIGPPATVGWAIVEPAQIRQASSGAPNGPQLDFSKLQVGGISFVGDITPVGHLLQLTTAITQCVRQASQYAKQIIIDTPGFICGPAAAILWWTVQQMLQPNMILAVQRADELSDVLAGLKSLDFELELIKSPTQISSKSPQDRRSYRQNQFDKYFQNSHLSNISLTDIAVRTTRNLSHQGFANRLVALRNESGADVAVGIITDWQDDKGVAVVRTPKIDVRQIRCLVIGDVTIDTAGARTQ